MLLRVLTIWLALCGSLAAQTIGGLSTVQPLTEARFPVSGLTVPAGTIDDLAKWAQKLVVDANGPDGAEWSIEVDIGLVKRQPVLYFSADRAGLYVLALVDSGAAAPKIATKRVYVGEVVPPAPNPTPPGPGPTPDPTPTPQPNPTPAPIPLPGLRVLVIYETNPGTTTMTDNVTREQALIITGAETRTLLSAKCAKDAKGHPEFRFYDQHSDLRNAAPHWFAAFNRPRGKLPWLIVSDGRKGYEGPLPANPQEFAKLLEGFGP